MTLRCDINPAQYERNRRFRHLVHALGRLASGTKLPCVGLCLNVNASKAVSFPIKGGNDISKSLVNRKAQNNMILLDFWSSAGHHTGSNCRMGSIRDPASGSHQESDWLLVVDHGFLPSSMSRLEIVCRRLRYLMVG